MKYVKTTTTIEIISIYSNRSYSNFWEHGFVNLWADLTSEEPQNGKIRGFWRHFRADNGNLDEV